MNESCTLPTHSRACHMRMSHVTRIHACDMTYSHIACFSHVWHDSFIREVAHSGVTRWHDSFICDMTHLYVTWLICMWHDSFVCDMTLHVKWLIPEQRVDITHSYVTWLICMWHDSFICDMTLKTTGPQGPKGSFLAGHSWKKLAGDLISKEGVAVRCSVLQRIAMCCSVLSHTYMRSCIHVLFYFLVADRGGTCRKETCKGPHIKCKGCRVLECVAVWRIELQG